MSKIRKDLNLTETLLHIRRVNELILEITKELLDRAVQHDDSKLRDPEAEGFDKVGGRLKNMTYGSKEYYDSLEELKPILRHHYDMNSHHPEHFYEAGIMGMDLFDLIEMLADWKAATERHDDGNIKDSLDKNRKRFDIDDQLFYILRNTLNRYEIFK